MAINLNHAQYGAQFTEFVNLAARNAGDQNSIVSLDEHERERAPEQLLGPNGEARVISVKDGDTIRPLLGARFGRSAENKALNNQIRNLFLETVLKVCGVRTAEELPESIRTAMKLKDYDNKGHPLTVRRITAVKAAIDANLNAEAEHIQREITTMLRRDFVDTRGPDEALRLINEGHALAKTLVDAANGDIELLRAIAEDNCALAKRILLEKVEVEEVDPAAKDKFFFDAKDIKKRTILNLRNSQQVVYDMARCRETINTFRTLAGGAPLGFRHLDEFVRQPIPADKLAEMAQAARDLDLEPVVNGLSSNVRATQFKALCRLQKMVNSVVARAGMPAGEDVAAAQAELRSSYFFAYDLICGRMSKENLEKLRRAIDNNPYIKTEASAVEAIAMGKWAEKNDEEPVKTKVRNFANSLSYCLQNVAQVAVWDALERRHGFAVTSLDRMKVGDIRPVYAQLKDIVEMEDVQPDIIGA